MSSRTVRNIVHQFLTTPNMQALPDIKLEWDNQMQLTATGISNPEQTIAALHIAKEVERRITTPAVTGITLVDYTMQLLICHFFDGQGSEVANALDDLVEAVKIRLRSDPRLGQGPSAVFESAQNPIGNKIIVNRGDTLYLNEGIANGVAITWVGVEWVVTEEVAA